MEVAPPPPADQTQGQGRLQQQQQRCRRASHGRQLGQLARERQPETETETAASGDNKNVNNNTNLPNLCTNSPTPSRAATAAGSKPTARSSLAMAATNSGFCLLRQALQPNHFGTYKLPSGARDHERKRHTTEAAGCQASSRSPGSWQRRTSARLARHRERALREQQQLADQHQEHQLIEIVVDSGDQQQQQHRVGALAAASDSPPAAGFLRSLVARLSSRSNQTAEAPSREENRSSAATWRQAAESRLALSEFRRYEESARGQRPGERPRVRRRRRVEAANQTDGHSRRRSRQQQQPTSQQVAGARVQSEIGFVECTAAAGASQAAPPLPATILRQPSGSARLVASDLSASIIGNSNEMQQQPTQEAQLTNSNQILLEAESMAARSGKGSRMNPYKRLDSDDSNSLASSASSLNNRPFCKICHMTTTKFGDRLISPCKCSGTMQFVHCSCLLKWLEISNRTNEKPISCELCSHEYTWHKRFNYHNLKWPKCSLKDMLLHLMFILAIVSMFVCVFAPMLRPSNPSDSSKLAEADGAASPAGGQHQLPTAAPARRQFNLEGRQFHHHSSISANGKLAGEEKFILLCAAIFFVSFFLAIYVQTKARRTLYCLTLKMIRMNQTYYISEYEHLAAGCSAPAAAAAAAAAAAGPNPNSISISSPINVIHNSTSGTSRLQTTMNHISHLEGNTRRDEQTEAGRRNENGCSYFDASDLLLAASEQTAANQLNYTPTANRQDHKR